MKKFAIAPIALVLTACGGETVFNAPADDMKACIVGNWSYDGDTVSNSIGTVYDQNYTFFSDGTYRHEYRFDIHYVVALNYWLEDTSQPFLEKGLVRRTGGWDYQNGLFYTRSMSGKTVFAETEEEALEQLKWTDLTPGVAISDPNARDVNAVSAHCDEQYFSDLVLKLTNESPLTYIGQFNQAEQIYIPASAETTELILLDDGTGTYKTTRGPRPVEPEERMYALEYSYNGNKIEGVYYDESRETESELEFIDVGPVLLWGPDLDYYIRKP